MAATEKRFPEILAPAGDTDCFLAALAAGADAIYLGLKQFSARMEADNFGLAELARLTTLAHQNNCRVFVAMNTLIKPNELLHAWRMVARLASQVKIDGLIVQDLAMVAIASQTGFKKSLAFSTLANVSFPVGLVQAARMGANRIIMPRELSLDEMKQMGEACPDNIELECFVHGALCYCISGRCYWSSYLGGKSSLRGRCVQPCRRNYAPGREAGESKRYFSCLDLEIGVLAKTLLTVPHLDCWKIEGRKKGPHYVFHTVTAYRILRDYPGDSAKKNLAQQILEQALGRTGVKANFLSQRPVKPMQPGKSTSSGMLAGKIAFKRNGECVMRARVELLPRDYLRVGVEDERWHTILPVRRAIPKGGELVIKFERHKTPKTGTPVFLIDRREPELENLLANFRAKLNEIKLPVLKDISGAPTLPTARRKIFVPDMTVEWEPRRKSCKNAVPAFWLTKKILKMPRQVLQGAFFWLPPDLWPENETAMTNLIQAACKMGAKNFVCNSPWQRGFFPVRPGENLLLVAGPFCNIANALAVEEFAKAGFKAAFASQELSGDDLKTLGRQSSLPIGLVLQGFFPVGISRFGLAEIESGEVFNSPKGELFWTAEHDGSTWIYPGWQLDLRQKRKELEKAGFSFFAVFNEPAPKRLPLSNRPGLFNWNGQLL